MPSLANSRRLSRSRAAGRILVGLALLIGLTALVGMQVTVPYVVISPGDATSTNDLVTVTGARTFRHRGGFYLMTVRVSSGRPNVWRFVQASLDDDTEVLGERDYYGPTPPARAQRQSVQMMDESELTATVAALTRLGYPVDFTGSRNWGSRLCLYKKSLSIFFADIISIIFWQKKLI